MIEIIIIVFIVWWFGKGKRSFGGGRSAFDFQKLSDALTGKKASAVSDRPRSAAAPKRQKASAVPNKPKKIARTKDEAAMEVRTRASSAACSYEAAYSKGRPARLGIRADYEPDTPAGKIRVRCSYCGAANFVPAGSSDHYHCYFCWEKL